MVRHRSVATALAGLIVLLVWPAGCSGTRRPDSARDADVLSFDASMIGLFDAGPSPGTDGGGPFDGGVVGRDGGLVLRDGSMSTDSGVVSGDCVLLVPVGRFGPLGRACLPRCSTTTAEAYRACTSQSCRNAAVDRDTTRGISYYIGSAPVTTPLDCGGCIAYQEMHCFSLVCGVEVDQYVDACIVGTDPLPCDDAIYRIDLCLGSLTSTENATVGACMSSEDGVEGCFP